MYWSCSIERCINFVLILHIDPWFRPFRNRILNAVMSLRACSLPRSTCRSFRNTFSRKKVTIDGLNIISNRELHVSDPLCDNENKDLTLVILTWKKTTVYLFIQRITCTTTECLFWKRQIYSEKVFGEGFSLQKIQINKLYYGSK